MADAPTGGDKSVGVGSISVGQSVTAYVQEVPHETLHLAIDGAIAVGTIAVAVLAIWGDKWRAWLVPPKVELQLHTPHGTPSTLTSGESALFYHLKAVNTSHLTVEKCRVLLTGISKRVGDGSYPPTEFPVPFPFSWSGLEPAPEDATVTTIRVVDFGSVTDGSGIYWPRLRGGPNKFDGYVRKGESVRYTLTIDASNYRHPKAQVFEVNWSGEHPVVSLITDPVAPWSA